MIRKKFGSFFLGGKDGRPEALKPFNIKNRVTAETRTRIDVLKLLGITCLHVAMKIEEVDLVSLRDILRPPPNCPPDLSISQVEQMEREVISVLKFKLLPDTLFFWFDLAVQLWDVFV